MKMINKFDLLYVWMAIVVIDSFSKNVECCSSDGGSKITSEQIVTNATTDEGPKKNDSKGRFDDANHG